MRQRFNRSFDWDMKILAPVSPSDLFVGVLSGTSMDGIDAALVRFDSQPELLGTFTLPFPSDVKEGLKTLSLPGDNEIDSFGRLDVRVGQLFAQAVQGLLEKAKIAPDFVRAIGSHGQTIRHRPGMRPPFTLQIGDPNVIAAQTGIPVVADFRRKDLALGGQGAPLVPAFHEAVFRNPGQDRVVVNIGGIANLTSLPGNSEKHIRGFDTGPGNTLLDAWCHYTLGTPMDEDGKFAARGLNRPPLLASFLGDPFFKAAPPKSTGLEYFSFSWIQKHLDGQNYDAADVQATLVRLTTESISTEIEKLPEIHQPTIFLCGGGARNPVLVDSLRTRLPQCSIQLSDALGVLGAWVEAMAFAWLAARYVDGLPGNCPPVTGASRPAVLGGLYMPD